VQTVIETRRISLQPKRPVCRKFRFAKEGGGKSGGYRVVTWFGGGDVPVFLLTVFAKGRQATLTPDERNGLARITAALKRARKQS
jgi:hypothetical protein